MSLLPTVVSGTDVLGAHGVLQGNFAGTFKSTLGNYVCILGEQATNLFHAFTSPDGITWTEQDAAHAPERSFTQTGYQQGSSCVQIGNILFCFANHGVVGTLTNVVNVSRFDMGANLWLGTTVSTLTFDAGSCSLTCTGELIALYRPIDGKVVLIAQAGQQNSSDSFCIPWPYFAHYDPIGDTFDSTWTPLIVVGSQPRAKVGYPLGAVMDLSSNCHVILRPSGADMVHVQLNRTDTVNLPNIITGSGEPDSSAVQLFPIIGPDGSLYFVYSTIGGEFVTMTSTPLPAITWTTQTLIDLVSDFVSGLPGVFIDTDGSMKVWYLDDQGTGGIQSLSQLTGPPGGPFTGPTILATAASRSNLMQAMSAGSVTALFVITGNATASLFVTIGEATYFTLTAVVPGVGGNAITFQVIGVGTPNLSLGVTVVGNAITVTVATDASGVSTSTRDQIVTLLQGDVGVSALVNTTPVGFSGFFTANFPLTHLAGGASAGGGTGFFFQPSSPPPSNSPASIMIPVGISGGPNCVVLPDPNFLCAFSKPKICRYARNGKKFVVTPHKMVFIRRT